MLSRSITPSVERVSLSMPDKRKYKEGKLLLGTSGSIYIYRPTGANLTALM